MTILNFRTVTRQTVDITAQSGEEFKLFDDVPSEVMLAALDINVIEAELAALPMKLRSYIRETPDDASGLSGAEERAIIDTLVEQLHETRETLALRQGELVAETLRVCGDIFRHTYPEMSDEEIAALFTHTQRYEIVQVFSRLRSPLSQTPSSDSEDSATTAAPDPAPAPANRAQRRRQATATTTTTPTGSRASGQGGIRSPKR